MRKLLTLIFVTLCFVAQAQTEEDTFRLYYPTGVSELNTTQQQYLDSLLEQKALVPETIYSIVGYADYVGVETSNMVLSFNRAAAVADYLYSKGFDKDSLFIIKGKGELYSSGTGNIGNPQDRKVEIIQGNLTITRHDTFNYIIYFKAGRDIILPESEYVTDSIFAIMGRYPRSRVVLQGYNCCDSCEKPLVDKEGWIYKYSNSITRARLIERYLQNRGIAEVRIDVNPYGVHQKRIGKLLSPADHKENRCVEVYLIVPQTNRRE